MNRSLSHRQNIHDHGQRPVIRTEKSCHRTAAGISPQGPAGFTARSWIVRFLLITGAAVLFVSGSTGVRAGSLMNDIQESGKQTKPIDITSSQLEANLKSHIIVFKGNVIAKQGDVVLYCDTLTAYYDAKDKNITMIVATGDVKITKKDMIATGTQAVFDNVSKLLTLTGSPRIWQAKNIIEGTKIIFHLGTDKIFVEGAKSLYNPQTQGIFHGQTP